MINKNLIRILWGVFKLKTVQEFLQIGFLGQTYPVGNGVKGNIYFLQLNHLSDIVLTFKDQKYN